MKRQDNKVVTVFYYDNRSLVLKHRVMHYPYTANGKVMIPTEFKKYRAILAVYEGDLTVLNKVGERILPMEDAA
ncbi:TIGR02922 family protein [Thalassotalea sp. 42_200_T64]|nr:TIGR02922 family protein [Thalassotalea sp. 42_200_T64]